MPLVPLDIARGMAQIEHQLQQLAQQLVGEACAHCSQCCCHTDLCEEAERSAFLRAVRAAAPSPAAPFCDHYGWLAATGCRLTAGRPAACYHYWCEPLRQALRECGEARRLAVAAGSMVYLHQQPHDLLLSDLSDSALAEVDWAPIRQRLAELQALTNGDHPAPEALQACLTTLAAAPV